MLWDPLFYHFLHSTPWELFLLSRWMSPSPPTSMKMVSTTMTSSWAIKIRTTTIDGKMDGDHLCGLRLFKFMSAIVLSHILDLDFILHCWWKWFTALNSKMPRIPDHSHCPWQPLFYLQASNSALTCVLGVKVFNALQWQPFANFFHEEIWMKDICIHLKFIHLLPPWSLLPWSFFPHFWVVYDIHSHMYFIQLIVN